MSFLPELASGRGTATRSGVVEGHDTVPLHHRLRRRSPSPGKLGEELS